MILDAILLFDSIKYVYYVYIYCYTCITYDNLSHRCHLDSPPCRHIALYVVYTLFLLRNAYNRLDNRHNSSHPKDPDSRSRRRKFAETKLSTEAPVRILR